MAKLLDVPRRARNNRYPRTFRKLSSEAVTGRRRRLRLSRTPNRKVFEGAQVVGNVAELADELRIATGS